jgi:hypothetical protein
MPEGRMLSKSIATSEQVASVSLLADYLFTRMIPHLDCDGRMAGSPRTVRGIVCPLREDVTAAQVGAALHELHAVGLIVLYVVDGQQYVEFPKFRHHQRGARFDRESASRIPPSSAGSQVDSGPTPDHSGSTPVVLPLSEVKGSEVKGSKVSPPKAAARRKPVAVPTWLSPYLSAWKQQYDGDMPVEPNVAVLRSLEKLHGADETLRRWRLYLSGTGSQYASASKLKAGWGEFGGPSIVRPSVVSRGAVLLDLLRKYDLFSYNGNRAEYDAKLARACDDPQAGPTFRDDVAAIRPTRGEIGGMNDHFKALEIEARLARVGVSA